jgi:hypothetical protein
MLSQRQKCHEIGQLHNESPLGGKQRVAFLPAEM